MNNALNGYGSWAFEGCIFVGVYIEDVNMAFSEGYNYFTHKNDRELRGRLQN